MKLQTIAFYTLGCRANQYQTELLKSEFSNVEYRISNFSSPADIYVINTCTVTHDAERKSRQAIRRALRQNPKAKVYVAGCYAKLEKEKIKELFPTISFISPSLLTSNLKPPTPRIRANLMIQDGCENFCSYCIVPFARGKIKSKPLADIIKEAQLLVDAGAREIILTGINLGSYKPGLIPVLQSLSKTKDLLRIRLSSIEPMYLTRELIDAVAAIPKVCNYLHIPLQSGDNNILKAMNRNYTAEDYLKLINHIRKTIPECGLSTDIIVGFPGEEEEEFKNTIKTIRAANFSRLHVFSYSKRKGTVAADLPNHVAEKIKKQRNKLLQELNIKLMQKFANQYVGKTIGVLVEKPGEGLTANFIRYKFVKNREPGSLQSIHVPFEKRSGPLIIEESLDQL